MLNVIYNKYVVDDDDCKNNDIDKIDDGKFICR